MKIDWRSVSHIGAAIVGQIVPGVAVAEELAWKLGAHDNAQKASDVAAMGKAVLTSLKAVTGKDLANDADVDQAIRGVTDAVVALNKILAHKTAAAAVL